MSDATLYTGARLIIGDRSIESTLSTGGFDEFLGIEAARATARKFGLIPENDDSMAKMAPQFAALQARGAEK